MTKKLITLRGKIDTIDQVIIRALAKRQSVAHAIAEEKQKVHLPVRDRAREQELQLIRRELACAYGIDVAWLDKIYKLILTQSKKIQKR